MAQFSQSHGQFSFALAEVNTQPVADKQLGERAVEKSRKTQLPRRRFLRDGALGMTGAALSIPAAASASSVAAPATTKAQLIGTSPFQRRVFNAYQKRQLASFTHLRQCWDFPEQAANDDETRYSERNYYASFTKTLPHNEFGEVDAAAYEQLIAAGESGLASDFDQVPLDVVATRKLANPLGSLRYGLAGLDGHATRITPAPEFRSAETAAEMVELYWQSLTRDLHFTDYDQSTLIADAASDLNRLSAPIAQRSAQSSNLFRGETPGDLLGPYISQLLFLDIPYGPSLIEQRYPAPLVGSDFMQTPQSWLAVQRGEVPSAPAPLESSPRYLYTGRGLAEYVHRDVLFQAFFNAALILLGIGGATAAPSNPYSNSHFNQSGFTSFGGPFAIDLLTQAGNLALSGAWYQKWRVHRRLRPETYGGRIHHAVVSGRDYELPSEILSSAGLEENLARHDNLFLSMAYPEGSPTHPAYPAGHACVAGACATVLKALFNEDYIFEQPVEANRDGTALVDYAGSDQLSVGGELNKLAANISLGRNTAGVHYRSDGIQGLLAGEQQAISLLQDYSVLTSEDFDGYLLTRFDGQPIRIVDGGVIEQL